MAEKTEIDDEAVKAAFEREWAKHNLKPNGQPLDKPAVPAVPATTPVKPAPVPASKK